MKSGFVVVFYRTIEDENDNLGGTTPVTMPVNTPDKDIQSKIVSLCLNAPQTREQLMQACGMKNKAHFLKAYLKPMLEAGELRLTVPDKPNSQNQKYIAVRHTAGEERRARKPDVTNAWTAAKSEYGLPMRKNQKVDFNSRLLVDFGLYFKAAGRSEPDYESWKRERVCGIQGKSWTA